MSGDITLVECPGCQAEVIWDSHSPWRPFCSKRCQLIDLGEWAAEEKFIAGSTALSDDEEWSESSFLNDPQ